LRSAITDNHIGQDFLVSMPDVWRRISIVDCRGNEVFHLMKLSLKLHNKIAKVTERKSISQQGRKGHKAITIYNKVTSPRM